MPCRGRHRSRYPDCLILSNSAFAAVVTLADLDCLDPFLRAVSRWLTARAAQSDRPWHVALGELGDLTSFPTPGDKTGHTDAPEHDGGGLRNSAYIVKGHIVIGNAIGVRVGNRDPADLFAVCRPKPEETVCNALGDCAQRTAIKGKKLNGERAAASGSDDVHS